MRFRRLKLSGFKSFVEPAELRIEPGLTGVVGPNGCGKSNLLEAIRWVMGEGSPKSLRGGGHGRRHLRRHRDPAGARFRRSVAADRARQRRAKAAGESEVTRRIERGAGSAYRIDGRDVRAKDVALLFADAATGAHSPALVSQGRIGAVIAAKPAERRLMLEEAAGISGLHARRKDAEQKLRATEANLLRLDEIMGDQEARAAALRRQARAAERYRELTDKIRAGRSAADLRPLGRGRPRGERGGRAKRARAEGEVARLQHDDAGGAGAAGAGRDARSPSGATRRSRRAMPGAALAHQLATARAAARHGGAAAGRARPAGHALAADTEREAALDDDADARDRRARGRAQARSRRGSPMPRRSPRGSPPTSPPPKPRSREAEAALAGLLASEAAMRAERRVAEAAIEAARDQVGAGRRRAAPARRSSSPRSATARAERAAIEAARVARDEAAARAWPRPRARLIAAEQGRAEAAEARDDGESALGAARAALSAARSERDALARALAQRRRRGAGRGARRAGL